MNLEIRQLEAAIAATQAQRALLGDVAVDAMLAGLNAKLSALRSVGTPARQFPETMQSLKQVSILFLDVVGSTTLAQRLDPEDVGAVMDGALSRGTAIVEAHRGRVLQYAGDNLLAVFGADESSEDDAERAVRCGLALLALGKTVGSEVLAAHGHAGLDVRVGVHTGGVLLGGGVDEDGSIRGQAVNVAARMEQTAPSGGLRISHDTYVQVRGLFEVGAPQSLVVKGVDAPVVSRLVQKAKPRRFRIAQRGLEGVATRMIGRDAEFEALQDAFSRLFSERQLTALTVVADAGVGKSRLLAEFEAWSEDRAQTFILLRGRATPQTQGQPFGLLRDIVAWRFQLSDDDTLDQAKARIEQGLAPLFPDGPEPAQAEAHLLGHLIGLDWRDSPHLRGILDDPQQIRNRGLHAAVEMLRRTSGSNNTPLILLLEDLHWADDESLDFLNHLIDVGRGMPLLILALTRPTLFERRAQGLGAQAQRQRIDLHPLDPAGSRLLADELLRKLPDVPAALRELVIGGAEGNPFYMEELVRMLIDQGAIDASGEAWRLNADRLEATKVPSTLTGVLQARLDGLPAEERLTLQEASVIGPVFWDRALMALDAVSQATLPRLVQRELTLPRSDVAADGLREYAFKHAILHQVTYGTVLRRQRKTLHAKLAHWLAGQSQGDSARADDFLGLTAHHYSEAGDHANAAEFHARAAEHAVERWAHPAVLEHVRKALSLLDRMEGNPTDVPLRWRLLRARERTLDSMGERVPQALDLDAMDDMAQKMGDDRLRAYAAYQRAYFHLRLADRPACERWARIAVDFTQAASTRRRDGPDERDSQDLAELRLFSLRLVATAMGHQGHRDAAETLLQQTLEEARARGLLKAQGHCLTSLGMIFGDRGEPIRALDTMRASLAVSRRLGDRRREAIGLGNVGVGWFDLGDLVAAKSHLEESLSMLRQHGERAMECGPLCMLSKLAWIAGDHPLALSLARSAREIATAVRMRDREAGGALLMGNAEMSLGRHAEALRHFLHAREVAETLDGDGMRFDAMAATARLALAQGDTALALHEVQSLLTLAGADANNEAGGFVSADVPRWVQLTIHQVLAAAADPRADAWLHRAYSDLAARAECIPDAPLRQTFLTKLPHHREIVTLWERKSA